MFRLETDINTITLGYKRLVDIGPWWFQFLPGVSVGYGFSDIEAVNGPDNNRRLDARIEADGMLYELGMQIRLWTPEMK